MNKQHFEAFLTRSQALWVLMETYRQAYAADADKLAWRADKLKWLTIGVGFLTGVLSIPVFLQVGAAEYIVAIFGVLTGSLTLVDKHFRWEELSTQTWMNQKALESLQRDLYNFAVDVGLSVSAGDPSLYIQQVNDRSEKFTNLRVTNIEDWANRAKEALRSHGIARIEFVGVADTSTEPEEFLTEDAEGIVEVTRG